jgi:hypothetical protein
VGEHVRQLHLDGVRELVELALHATLADLVGEFFPRQLGLVPGSSASSTMPGGNS